jgi:hypothetical protein
MDRTKEQRQGGLGWFLPHSSGEVKKKVNFQTWVSLGYTSVSACVTCMVQEVDCNLLNSLIDPMNSTEQKEKSKKPKYFYFILFSKRSTVNIY